MRYTRTFAGEASSVSAARHFVNQALPRVPQDALDAITLMVSELATNSIRFTAGDFTVRIDDGTERTRVEVSDEGAGTPTVRAPRPDETSGRGLLIVDAMSDAWGVDRASDGSRKTVWFTWQHLFSDSVPSR